MGEVLKDCILFFSWVIFYALEVWVVCRVVSWILPDKKKENCEAGC